MSSASTDLEKRIHETLARHGMASNENKPEEIGKKRNSVTFNDNSYGSSSYEPVTPSWRADADSRSFSQTTVSMEVTVFKMS